MLIDWFTVAAQALNFVALIWLLQHFLYKPVLAAIDARDKSIASQVREAAAKRTEADQAQAEFQKMKQQFEEQRQSLTDQAAAERLAEKETRAEVSRQQMASTRTEMQERLQAEYKRMRGDLQTQVQQEVMAMAGKVLQELAGADLERQILQAFGQRLRDLPATQKDKFRSDQPALVRSSAALSVQQQKEFAGWLGDLLGPSGSLQFEVRPELVAGLELVSNGQKFAWNIADCLDSLNAAPEQSLHVV